MKHHLLYFLLVPLFSYSQEKDEHQPNKKRPLIEQKKFDIEQEMLDIYNQFAHLLHASNAPRASKTPKLDTYKCAFILGSLNPNNKEKLYREIPDEIGALAAQKKHMGKKLSLKEELELSQWNSRMIEKHSPNPSKG